MNYLRRYFIRKAIFTIAILILASMLYQPLLLTFMNNPLLNGIILGVLLIGILLNFYRLFLLHNEQTWLESFEKGKERFPSAPSPRILAPLALTLRDFRSPSSLSPFATRSLLASIEARLDEERNIIRYSMGLLIFLGLLGTFWGLSQTIGAIVGVMTGLDMGGSTDLKETFQVLKEALESPLSGMGTAFSSSLFGLAGSLILGFLDLQATKASTIFYQGVEDHLTLITRVQGEEEEVQNSGPAYTLSMLEQAAENMGQLQLLIRRSEDGRTSVVRTIKEVTEKIALLADQMTAQQLVLKTITQNQIEVQECISQLSTSISAASYGMDDNLKQHLRNLDITTGRLLEETVHGRERCIQELRNEVRLVARTISALANGQEVAA